MYEIGNYYICRGGYWKRQWKLLYVWGCLELAMPMQVFSPRRKEMNLVVSQN